MLRKETRILPIEKGSDILKLDYVYVKLRLYEKNYSKFLDILYDTKVIRMIVEVEE